MPSVFVYEWCTALGIGRAVDDPAHSLYREGLAMRDAVVEDFTSAGYEVRTLEFDVSIRKRQTIRERDSFRAIVKEVDGVLVIAPELGGELSRRCDWVEKFGGRLLGPDVDSVQTCSNKIDLAKHWVSHGVRTPRTNSFLDWLREPSVFPAICKPVDGAGSMGIRRVENMDEVHNIWRAGGYDDFTPSDLVLQDYVPGFAASVAFLVGSTQSVPLLPASQILSEDGRFHYLGGEMPLEPALAARTIAIASQAIACVLGLRGYVGVDVILGNATDSSQDYAIEINPRLTTSYLGLRAICEDNLAHLMYLAASGEPIPKPRWKPGRVRF